MCINLHTCSSHAFEHFPRCPFCIPALRSPPVVISTFLSCVGIKHFWIGPRLAKRPWFTTGRPPVKFRIILTSFDTPTVNRGTEKASCVLQPNRPDKATYLANHKKTRLWTWTQLAASPHTVLFRWKLFLDHVDHAAPRAPGRWTTARPRKGTTRSRGRRGSGCPHVEEYEGSLVRLWCEAAAAE